MISLKLYKGGLVDAHLHLRDKPGGLKTHPLQHDPKTPVENVHCWSAVAAVEQLLLEMNSCNVGHAVVLHLLCMVVHLLVNPSYSLVRMNAQR